MNPTTTVLRCWLGLAAICIATASDAQATFRISQVFSNVDGSIQFVALTETAGADDQYHFSGLTLTVTQAGFTKRFVFGANLATAETAYITIVVAAVQDTAIYDFTGNIIIHSRPDFLLPARFIPAAGGTIDFAGIDATTYPALPLDGSTAWYRDGTIAPAKLPGNWYCAVTPSSLCAGSITPTPTLVQAVEYYNAELDHYFVTASGAEIDALDSARIRGWQRTGYILQVGQIPNTEDSVISYHGVPVCRFYLPPANGDSHFFSASPDECAAVASHFPQFIRETTAAFYAALPDPNGQCGFVFNFALDSYQLRAVYRLWNQRADSNHRYTSEPAIRDAMIARGWLPDGYGPLGVVMCVR